jgi:AraC family transcriptional regulator
MDEHNMPRERIDMSERRPVAIQARDEERGALLRIVHHTQTTDDVLTDMLLTVVFELMEAMANTLSKDREATRECVRHACATLLRCVQDAEVSLAAILAKANERRANRGGLAPWQIRTLTTYIDANLNASLSCEELARLSQLSVSYFARAFKLSFGYSPHGFVLRRRMQRAQVLMLTSNSPLAEIAMECGFADQSHMSRLFLQFTGESPAAWRRARAIGLG